MANNLRESASASSELVDTLINQEIQQSAARIQAEMLAEANRNLADSITQVNEAQGTNRVSPVANVTAEDPQAIAQRQLTLTTREQMEERMALQLEELNEAERVNELRLAIIEKQKTGTASKESLLAQTGSNLKRIKTAQRRSQYALRSIAQQIIQAEISKSYCSMLFLRLVGLSTLRIRPRLLDIATNALCSTT